MVREVLYYLEEVNYSLFWVIEIKQVCVISSALLCLGYCLRDFNKRVRIHNKGGFFDGNTVMQGSLTDDTC